MTKGVITTLQRMSVHDGPGLRTVVFMKGCNMRCRWCHNPETWSPHRQVQYIREKCIRCLTCAAVCPNRAIRPSEDGPRMDFDQCRACGTCADDCCTGAMSLVGREVSVEELRDEVRKDIPYFLNSGGGVTVSGGEPMLQKDFVREFLSVCRADGINTAIETNMAVEWADLNEVSTLVDFWMCDLKIYDSEKHKKWTGAGNRTVVDNILKMAATGRQMTVRTPVIPCVNDTAAEIEDICRLLAPFSGTVSYELMGFHTLGFSKYKSMGISNELEDAVCLPADQLEELKKIPVKYNL